MKPNESKQMGTELNAVTRTTMMTQQGRPFPYTRSRNNAQLTALWIEGPLTTDELPSGANLSPQARRFVGKLDPPWSDGTAVWYLWGDERRAVRQFLSLNEDNVREAMDNVNSTLSTRLDEAMWQLVCEEWLWGDYMSDDEIAKYRREERDDDNEESDDE